MESRDMNVRINKEKSIGKVLYSVEGNKTEALILYYIFCKIYDYQFESILRGKGYHKYNSKENIMSQVFVINTEESNIKTIDKDNDFLNNLYITLFEQYDFNVDNAAIYYLFDRDYQSNKDVLFINADSMGRLINRKIRVLEDEDINKIVKAYKDFENGTLENVDGFCKAAYIEEIKSKDYSLNPGRYVGADSSGQLSEEEIQEELKNASKELLELMKEGRELEDKVKEILEEEIK